MNSKRCLKCNHVATFEAAPPLACPQCGAVYSKVEEALRNGPPVDGESKKVRPHHASAMRGLMCTRSPSACAARAFTPSGASWWGW